MQPMVRVLLATRAPTVLVAVVSLLLLLPPQLHDILASFRDRLRAGAMFQVSLAVLAFLVWYWSRAALNASIAMTDARAKRLTVEAAGWWWTQWPLVLFAAVGAIGLALECRSAAWTPAAVTLGWTAAGMLGLWARRKRAAAPALRPDHERDSRWGRLVDGAPFGSRRFAYGVIATGLFAFLLAGVETFLWPDELALSDLVAQVFPGPAAALACFALMLGPVTMLTVWAHRTRLRLRIGRCRIGVPVPWLLIGALLVGGSFQLPLHAVRLARQDAMPPSDRIELADALGSWIGACTSGTGRVRPVIVALSGGASRAGLWSSRVLRAIDLAVPDHGGGVFAISSVSGGSLGAADYVLGRAAARSSRCHLDEARRAGPAPAADAAGRERLFGAYGRDMLGPLLAGFLLDDTARALLAVPLWPVLDAAGLWPPRGGDRASALERAWERAWSGGAGSGGAASGGLGSDYLDAFYVCRTGERACWRPGMPIWLSNGTDVVGGERLITAPIKAGPRRVPPGGLDLQRSWPFEGAKDVLALLHSDVRMSTAVLNSGRFPFLSPSGGLRPASAADAHGPYAQILDGGIFENSGVTTGFELVTWLRDYGADVLAEDGVNTKGLVIDPILVAVDADAEPSVTGDDVPRCGHGPPRDPQWYGRAEVAPQLLAPLAALYNTRSGHGDYAIQKAREAMCNQLAEHIPVLDGSGPGPPPPPAFFHFYLHATTSGLIPLNWALSPEAEERIWDNFAARKAASWTDSDNWLEFTRLDQAIDPQAGVRMATQ